MPQLSACQPTPTRSPMARSRTSEPTAVTVADDLVTGNEGVLAEAPIVVDEVNVGVADAAVRDANLNLVGLQLSGVVFVSQQLGTGRVHRKTVNFTHETLFLLRPGAGRGNSLMLHQAGYGFCRLRWKERVEPFEGSFVS